MTMEGKTINERVLDRIKENELVELSRALVKIPSPTGQEKAVSDFVVSHMRDLKMDAQGVEGEKDRPNAVGTWKGVEGSKTIMFSGHMDTVGPGDPAKWRTDPFGGEVIDGKIYGRGAMDSKGGGIASTLVALKAIMDEGLELKNNITVVGTVDEEVGGRLGMRYVIGNEFVKPDMCIYCVHSDMEIKAYFKGVLWAKVTVRGTTAHGSTPEDGVNAITRAATIMTELEKRGMTYDPHPILGHATRNFGWIHGQEAYDERLRYNVVADLCEFGIDNRLVIGQTPQGVYDEIMEVINDLSRDDPDLDASVEIIMQDTPASVSEEEPILKIVKRAATEVMGKSPVIGGTIAAGDLAPIFKKGLVGVGFGPGDLKRGNAHKENEFIEIDQLVMASKAYALMMLDAGEMVDS